jgi:O-antigen/teichoic acid export membrane protein
MSLALVEVFSIIYFRVTQVILETYAGYSQVGVYGASYKLVEAFTNIPSILMIVLFPGFARLAVENISDFRLQFGKVLKMLIVMGLGSSLICWLLGKEIFSLLGKDYGESYLLVRYMTLALTAIFPNYLLTQALIALDQNLKYASVLFIVLGLNIVISILLVPNYGAYGSAISVGLCEVVIFISCFYLISKILNERQAKA